MAVNVKSMATILLLLGIATYNTDGAEVVQIQLKDGKSYLSLQDDDRGVLQCVYRLDRGEQASEVLWVRGGRLLQATTPAEDVIPGVEYTSELVINKLSRKKAGVYRCAVRTMDGADHTMNYELLIIDTPNGGHFNHSSHKHDCLYHVSVETPASYPEGSAFCGVWFNGSSSPTPNTISNDPDGGVWLVPPPKEGSYLSPKIVGSNDVEVGHGLSYSSLVGGEWSRVYYPHQLVALRLNNATFKLEDVPINSYIRCNYGYYKKDSAYISIASIAINTADVEDECLASELLQHTTRGSLTLEFSDHKKQCQGYISPLFGRPLIATFRCPQSQRSLQLRLRCTKRQWRVSSGDVDGHSHEGYTQDLRQLEVMCNRPPIETSAASLTNRAVVSSSAAPVSSVRDSSTSSATTLMAGTLARRLLSAALVLFANYLVLHTSHRLV